MDIDAYFRDFYVRTKPLFNTSALTYAGLATLFGGIPPLSLLKRLFEFWTGTSFNLFWLPKMLLAGYQFVRDKLLSYLLSAANLLSDLLPDQIAIYFKTFIHLLFSSLVIDILSLWIIIAFGIFRGSLKNRTTDRQRLRSDPNGFRNSLREAAHLNNLDPDKLIERVETGLAPGLKANAYFFYRSLRSCIR